MTRVVHHVQAGPTPFTLSESCRPLLFTERDGVPTLWYERPMSEGDLSKTAIEYRIFGTGHLIDDPEWVHVASTQLDGWFMAHLYRRPLS